MTLIFLSFMLAVVVIVLLHQAGIIHYKKLGKTKLQFLLLLFVGGLYVFFASALYAYSSKYDGLDTRKSYSCGRSALAHAVDLSTGWKWNVCFGVFFTHAKTRCYQADGVYIEAGEICFCNYLATKDTPYCEADYARKMEKMRREFPDYFE